MTDQQRWFSEPLGATGGSFAGGVLNALGRPQLIASTVLVRETVQNSWDARIGDDIIVDFALDTKVMRGDEFVALKSYILDTAPPHLALRQSLEKHAIPVILISDRGTRGLAGAVTADVRVGDRSDFADFFFNVGRTSQRAAGGGTYGFGKSVLYLASAAGSILVYTRCRTPDGHESRLMGSALGDDFTDPGARGATFTGRHWWGTVSEDRSSVRPVIGGYADSLASALGFPLMSGTQTGTSIMVLDFAPESDRSLEDVSRDLAWALVWNCWPKSRTRANRVQPAMQFSVTCETTPIPIPSMDEVPALTALARCMDALDGEISSDVRLHEITSAKPARRLGYLSLVTYRSTPSDDAEATRAPIDLPGHHVALMRSPELIVTYRGEVSLDTPEVGWVGVFRAADGEIDQVFASSEPPTHDAWVVEQLERRHDRSFVRIALNRIRERVNDFVRPAQPGVEPVALPVARIGDALAGLVARARGDVPPVAPLPPSPPSKPHARVALDGPMRLARVNGILTAVQRFTVHHLAGSAGTLVSAHAGVLTQGGEVERTPPAGGVTSRVLAWESDDGEPADAGGPLRTMVDDARYWEVTVLVPDDAAIALDLTAEAMNEP